MENTTPSDTSPKRPDLNKIPVATQTLENAGGGALLGASGGLGCELSNIKNKKPVSWKAMGVVTTAVAAIMGYAGFVRSNVINDERKKTRPYVEKLEGELAAKSAAPDNSPQR